MLQERSNPLLALPFEPSLEGLGPDYWDVVEAARFPLTRLRFRNEDLLTQLGLDPAAIRDQDLEAAFGRFEAHPPPCWLCATTAISSAATPRSWGTVAASSTGSCTIAGATCRTW